LHKPTAVALRLLTKRDNESNCGSKVVREHGAKCSNSSRPQEHTTPRPGFHNAYAVFPSPRGEREK
jgi:hypothetical protein